jgi:CRISPR-associated protein Cas2
VVVLIVERVSPSVRGELTRWMLEVHPGVFAGKVPASVREKLWELACNKLRGGAALIIHPADNEQGFAVRTWGKSSRRVVDFDGLSLMKFLQ